MSYILDALKRADTERERERGSVPGLHSLNLPSGALSRERRRKAASTTPYAAGLGLVLLVLAAWWLFRSTPEEAPHLAQPATPGIEDRPSAPPPAAAETAVAGPAVRPAPELPILAPQPPAAPPPPVRAERPRAASAANAVAAPGTAAPVTTAPPPQPTPSAAVRRFAELSPEFRAQLPQVNISGSTYSSNPAQRTLIANGKMVQEGQEIAPGLLLETIGQRSAVLNFQGTRYSIGY